MTNKKRSMRNIRNETKADQHSLTVLAFPGVMPAKEYSCDLIGQRLT